MDESGPMDGSWVDGWILGGQILGGWVKVGWIDVERKDVCGGSTSRRVLHRAAAIRINLVGVSLAKA